MICTHPIRLTKTYKNNLVGSIFRCGRCTACRIQKQQIWAGRILLEAKLHKHSTFATMTYSPENQVKSVDVKTMQDWQKRVRKAYSARFRWKVRFFTVGEYGDKTGRAHYHSIIFGAHPYEAEEIVTDTWGKGFIKVDEITPARARYISHYTVKKWRKGHPDLDGRNAEFAIQSRNPGIGYGMIPKIANTIVKYADHQIREELNCDEMGLIRIDGALYPMGTYIGRQVRNTVLATAQGLPEDTRHKIIRQYKTQHLNFLKTYDPEYDKELEIAKQHDKHKSKRKHTI